MVVASWLKISDQIVSEVNKLQLWANVAAHAQCAIEAVIT